MSIDVSVSRGKARLSYRADIDGLRAVAVLSVVFCHAQIGLFRGGFVGVDVFFVISGFLISGLIMTEVENGRFDILRFAERRARRILPALFAVIIASLAVGWAIFLPNDFENLGFSAIAAALSWSNFYFWSETGYFDVAAKLKPLLHTWSLGVEEQFYLVFPLIILACMRFGTSRSLVIGILFCLSLAASVVSVKVAPDAAFYFSPLRAWELLLGALVANSAIPPQNTTQKDVAALAGLLLVAGAVFFFRRQTPFPGALALVPAGGAALILWSGMGGTGRVSAFLTAPVIVGVGLISYSLYLWHWPMFVFAQYILMRKPTALETLPLIVASVMVAYASWRVIEEPIRRGRWLKQKSSFLAATLAGLSICVALGVVVVNGKGMPARLTPELAEMVQYAHGYQDWQDCHDVKADRIQSGNLCILGRTEQTPTFVLFGDSHAAALSPAISDAAMQEGVSGYQYTGQKMPLPGGRAPQLFLEFLRNHDNIRLVVLTGIWEKRIAADKLGPEKSDVTRLRTTEEKSRLYSDGLFELVRLFPDRNFAILEDVPTGDQLDGSLVARAMFLRMDPSRQSFGISRQEYERQRAAYVGIFDKALTSPNAFVVSIADKLCDEQYCPAVRNNFILYRDWHHLSPMGAALLVDSMRMTLRRGLRLEGAIETEDIRPSSVN